jgi:hypothetical protein
VNRCCRTLAALRPSARILRSGKPCGPGPIACARTAAAAGSLRDNQLQPLAPDSTCTDGARTHIRGAERAARGRKRHRRAHTRQENRSKIRSAHHRRLPQLSGISHSYASGFSAIARRLVQVQGGRTRVWTARGTSPACQRRAPPGHPSRAGNRAKYTNSKLWRLRGSGEERASTCCRCGALPAPLLNRGREKE